MKHPLLYNNKAFTLIEIMIAMAIMASLALLTATGIQNTLASKKKVQAKIDAQSKIRTAVKVIRNDIESAFHYNNFNLEILDELRRDIAKGNAEKNNNRPGQAPNSGSGNPLGSNRDQESEDGKKITAQTIITDYISQYSKERAKTEFLGDRNEIHFTTLNHARRYRDVQESNMAEVGYYLEDCRSLLDNNQRSQCLWRRSSPFIDDKVDEGGGATVLLENVKRLEFFYFKPEEEEWMNKWYSNQRGDDYTKGKFPQAIRIILEVEIGEKTLKDESVVLVTFPNNKEKPKATGGLNAPSS